LLQVRAITDLPNFPNTSVMRPIFQFKSRDVTW